MNTQAARVESTGSPDPSRGTGGVGTRGAAWLARSLWALTIALVGGALFLVVISRSEAPLYDYWISSLTSPAYATLGVLIVSRRPENVIGWIFVVLSVAGGLQMFSGQYATEALFSGDARLPGGAVAAWLSNLMQTSFVYSILFLVLLFPSGKLLSLRWRVVAWIGGLAIAASVVSLAFLPGPLESFPSVRNPFGGPAFLDWIYAVGGLISLACLVAAIASLILRFRRSRAQERMQLKWFVFAAALGFIAVLLVTFFDLPAVDEQTDAVVETIVWTLAPLSLPFSAGIAILRYRLYDIDVLINRTLVYGSVTAMLLAVYFGGVATTQTIFRVLTGHEQQPQLTIVASTLVIAAIFNPLRRRIQSFIDRHFYRSKYDAARTLEAFSAKLREETDLEALNDDLVGVVGETMQPAHVTLWLRPSNEVGKGRSEEQSR
jgi:hypothetical protein